MPPTSDTNSSKPSSPRRQTFRRSARLSGKPAFSAVFEAKIKAASGPLILYVLPKPTGPLRLGISISRAVGTAVKRNRIKRLLREAFRKIRSAPPTLTSPPHDCVVVVRPHQTFSAQMYHAQLQKLLSKLLPTPTSPLPPPPPPPASKHT